MEQAAQLTGGHRLAGPSAGNRPWFLSRRSRIVARWPPLPPLSQEIEHLRRQHNIAILAARGLLDTNDLLSTVDMLDLQSDDLAGAQATTIAEAEQDSDLEAAGDGQQAPRLIRAHHLRDLL